MDETTTASAATGTHVDEQARFRAFAALAVSLTALAGGGVFSSIVQWMVLRYAVSSSGDHYVVASAAAAPLVLGAAAIWLSLAAVTSPDPVARPMGRAATVLGTLGVAGATALVLTTLALPLPGQS